MFIVTGKLSDKSIMKTGVSEKGIWKIMTFLIEKTRKRKPLKIPFTAKGKLADKINDIAIGEKITIRFFIEGKKYNDKYFTDCVAIEIDKFVSKPKYQVSFGEQVYNEQTCEFVKDNNLFNNNNNQYEKEL